MFVYREVTLKLLFFRRSPVAILKDYLSFNWNEEFLFVDLFLIVCRLYARHLENALIGVFQKSPDQMYYMSYTSSYKFDEPTFSQSDLPVVLLKIFFLPQISLQLLNNLLRLFITLFHDCVQCVATFTHGHELMRLFI